MKRHDIFTIHAAPFYAYRKQVILRQAQKLKQVFPDFEILYSIKTNPFFPILQTVSEFGLGADAASAKEVSESRRAGIPSERIYFSAPGKTRDELEDAVTSLPTAFTNLTCATVLHRKNMLFCPSAFVSIRHFPWKEQKEGLPNSALTRNSSSLPMRSTIFLPCVLRAFMYISSHRFWMQTS